MSAHFFFSSPPARLTLGFLSGGLLYPKSPKSVFKKDQLSYPAPGHHSTSCAPNTTDLPEAGSPGSALDTRARMSLEIWFHKEGGDKRLISRLEIVPTTLSEPRAEHHRRTYLRAHRLTLSGNTKEVDGQAKSGIVGRSSVPGPVGRLGFSLTSEGSD